MSRKASPNDTASGSTPRRRRKWPWLLAVLVVLLAVLVVLGPNLLGTGFVRDRVLGYAGDQVDSRVTARSLSLSWFGKQEIQGLSMTTSDGAPVATVEYAALDEGLWGLLWGRRPMGAVALRDAEVVVENAWKLPEALPEEPEKEEQEAPPEPARPPTLPVSVEIRDLRLRAKEALITVDKADFTSSPDGDRFSASYTVTKGTHTGRGTVEGRLQGLSEDWQGANGIGATAVAEVEEVPMAALFETLAAMDVALEGSGTLGGKTNLRRERNGAFEAEGGWTLRDLKMTGKALSGDTVHMDKVQLAFRAITENDVLKVEDFTIESPVVRAKASGHFLMPEGGEKAQDAAPAEGGTAKLTVDLARLASMLPETLHLKENTEVTSGTLNAEVTMRTEDGGPALLVTADVTNVQGTREGRELALDPIEVRADVLRPATDFRARQIRATGPFGFLDGSGSLEDFKLLADVDLAAAVDQVAQFFDLGGMRLTGTFGGTVTTRGTYGEGVTATADGTLTDFAYGTTDAETGEADLLWEEPRVALSATADLGFDKEEALASVTVPEAKVTFAAGRLTAKADLRRASPEWSLDAEVTGSGDVGPLAQRIARLRDQPPPGATGTWTLTAHADGTLGRTMEADFAASTSDLTYAPATGEGEDPVAPKAVGDLHVTALLTTTTTKDGSRDIRVPKIEATGPGTTVTVTDLHLALAEDDLTADGGAEAHLRFAEMTDLLATFGLLSPGSRMAGTAHFDGRVATEGQRVTGKGTLKARDLDVYLADSEIEITESEVVVPMDVLYVRDQKQLGVNLVDIRSRLVSGTIKGGAAFGKGATSIRSDAALEINGASAARIFGDRLPEGLVLRDIWTVHADVSGTIPAGAETLAEQVAGLTGNGSIQIGTFEYEGLVGDQGLIAWRLGNGRIQVTRPETPSEIRVNEGVVRLDGVVDLTEAPIRYRLDQPTQIVRDVRMEGKVAEKLLVYMSPLLGYTLKEGGRLQVDLRQADLPFGDLIRTEGLLLGKLSVVGYKAELKGPLDALRKFFGVKAGQGESPLGRLLGGGATPENQEAEGGPIAEPTNFGPVPIHLENGRFHMENQSVTLRDPAFRDAGYTLKIDGSVGLDHTLDTVVIFPLTEGLLQRVGVPLTEDGLFTDVFIRIPLTGTVTEPNLAKERILPEAINAVRDTFLQGGRSLENVGDLLKDLFKKPGEGNESPPPVEGPGESPPPEGGAETPTPDEPKHPLRDLIEGLLKPKEAAPRETEPKPK